MFSDDMVSYVENPKDATKKLRRSKYTHTYITKVSGYKINIHKSFPFLYINNYLKEKLRNQFHLQ